MDFCRVSVEAHRFGGTIYIAGFLADLAATRAEVLIQGLSHETRVLRVDLRAVELIDPDSFVRVVRILNRWRDLRCGRVCIEFPMRSLRSSTGATRSHRAVLAREALAFSADTTDIFVSAS